MTIFGVADRTISANIEYNDTLGMTIRLAVQLVSY